MAMIAAPLYDKIDYNAHNSNTAVSTLASL